jgi:peptide/nickel transport system substrate-binding protein
VRSASAFRLPLALVMALAVACSTAGPASQSPGTSAAGSAAANFDASSTLTIRVNGDFATFEPSEKIGNLPDSQIHPSLYDRLVFVGSDGKTQPYLASSWDVTPTTLKFNIQKGITCSDGTALTPSAIAKHFDRVLGISDPKTKTPFVAGEFGNGPFTVSADDAAGTFTLNLGSPFSEAVNGLAFGTDGEIVCPKGTADPTILQTKPDGSGPYTLVSADHTTGVTVKLRSDWKWGPGGRTSAGLPGTIVFKIIANDTTAANALVTGELDIARILSGNDVTRLLADKSLGVSVKTPFYTNPMWLNINAGHPTSDKAVRQALVTAVSSEDYNQATYGGYGTAVTSWFSKDAPCYEPKTADILPKTSIPDAKQVLINAGYQTNSAGKFMGKDGKPLTVQVVGDTAQAPGVEYFLSQFNSLGLTVTPIVVDHVTYSAEYLAKGNWDVIVPGIASDTLGSYALFYFGKNPTQGGRNYSYMTDETFQNEVQQALTSSGDTACNLWKKVQTDWISNYYGRPLSAANFYFFYKNPKWTFASTEANLFPATLK